MLHAIVLLAVNYTLRLNSIDEMKATGLMQTGKAKTFQKIATAKTHKKQNYATF